MHDLYNLKEMLCKELEEYGRKGDIDKTTLEVVDKLAHATKNIGKIIEMCEEEEGYSSKGGGSYENRMSYARGRGMGRRHGANQYGSYAGGYSRASEDIASELREIMHDAPNDHIKREIQTLVSKIENM